MATNFRPACVHPGVVHLALAVGGFAIGTTEFATMSLLPYMASDLRISVPVAGHVISAYALGVVAGAPLIAVLSARLERRALLVGLMVLFAAANGLSALAPSYGWMVFFRFLSGLPHGAYFGIAMLVAASLVRTDQRTQAVGWRWGFGVVTVLALATAALVAVFAPRQMPDAQASPLRELGALKRRQVWLTLAIGAIGFGGLFAVYAYLTSTLMAVTGVPARTVPIVFAAFGVGMTAGNIIVPVFADRALMRTAGLLLLWSAAVLALFTVAAANFWTVMLDVMAIGFGGSLATVLQTRLMDVAGDAQSLAAALNHSAFNVANALGPLLGGFAIAAGYGWISTGWVGCGLALAGFCVWMIALAADPGRRASAVVRENA